MTDASAQPYRAFMMIINVEVLDEDELRMLAAHEYASDRGDDADGASVAEHYPTDHLIGWLLARSARRSIWADSFPGFRVIGSSGAVRNPEFEVRPED